MVCRQILVVESSNLCQRIPGENDSYNELDAIGSLLSDLSDTEKSAKTLELQSLSPAISIVDAKQRSF